MHIHTRTTSPSLINIVLLQSPERISGEEYGYASDIWSFGLSIMVCALGKFPFTTSGGYWGLLHVLRDEPPPELPKDSSFSECFSDFLGHCLEKDPSMRWTASQLLSHPFVEGCTVTSGSGCVEEDGSETARSELGSIVDAVMSAAGEDGVDLDERKIAGLAEQLGVSKFAVERSFLRRGGRIGVAK